MMGFSSKVPPGLMISQTQESHLSSNHEESLNLRRNNFVFILLVVLLNLNIIGDVIVFGNSQNMGKDDEDRRSLLQRGRGSYVYNEDGEGQEMEKFGYNESLEGEVIFGNSSSQGIDESSGFVGVFEEFYGEHSGNLLQKVEDHFAALGRDRRLETRDPNLNKSPREILKINDGSEMIHKHKFEVSQESETRKHHTKRRHHSTKNQLEQEPGTDNRETLQQGYYGSILTGIADDNGMDNVQSSGTSTHAERRHHLGGGEIRLQQEGDDDDVNFSDEDKSWKKYFWRNIVHRSRKAKSRKLSRKLRVPGVDSVNGEVRMYSVDESLERRDEIHQNNHVEHMNYYQEKDSSTNLELRRPESSYRTDDGTEFGRRLEAQKEGRTGGKVRESLGETKVKTYPKNGSKQGDRRKRKHKSRHSRLPEDLVANADHVGQKHSIHQHRDPNQHINILPQKKNDEIELDSMVLEEPRSEYINLEDNFHGDHDRKTVEHILEHHKTNVKHKNVRKKEHATRRLRRPEDITSRNHHQKSQASFKNKSRSGNIKTHFNPSNIDSNALSKIEENHLEELPHSQSNSKGISDSKLNASHTKNLSDLHLNLRSPTNFATRRKVSHFHDSSSNRLNPFYNFDSFNYSSNASPSGFNGYNNSNASHNNQSSEFKPKPRSATNFQPQRNNFNAFSNYKKNPFSNFNGFGNNFNSSSNSFYNNFNISSYNQASEFVSEPRSATSSSSSTNNITPKNNMFFDNFNGFYNNFNSSSNSFNISSSSQPSEFVSKPRSATSSSSFTNNIAPKNKMFFDNFNDFYNNFNTSYTNQSSDYLPKPRSATNNFLPKKSGRFYEEATTYFQGTDKPVWPVKKEAVLEGDIILGGLMMVHEREESITCGPIMPEGGVQALEAMLYTLDVLNSRPDKKFTLGAHILDDCDKDTYGLEMAVDFIKGSISNIEDAEFHCNKTQVRKVISGVVGAASSVTSIQVANLLRLFKIPQVSFFSTSPELSNKQRFEYFTRTIPSDHHQVQAMVEIVRRLRWSYVSIIYEESNYGIKAFEELEVLLAKYDICIAVKEKLVKDSGVAEETSYDSIVQKLLTKPRAKGTIIFGSDQEVAGFMRAVRRCNATGAFSWIGSDGWSARSLVWQGQEAEVEGTLSVQPQANPVKGFDNYFLNLTVENNKRNPWFVEFWEDHFQCRYPNSSRTPYNQKYSRECDSNLRLNRDSTRFENQLQFVSDAVMAFAVAFHDMHREVCGVTKKRGLCDAMRPIKGPDLLKYLRKVNFEGLSGDKFRFDPNGDGPARYNIIHFKQISAGNFSWIRVGEYIEGELRLDMDAIQFRLGHTKHPDSVCSFPCELGQAKKYVEGESCCWHCFNCSQYQVRHPDDETQCLSCPWGTIPDPSKQHCLHIPEVFLRAESAWAICAMCLSATGILLTLFIIGVFVRHNDTPVVKAAGRELSYVLLTGILLCYLVTFVLVLRPTDVVCGVQRFGTGFCFTVVYAAILTKTNRISRIFNAGKRTAKRPSFITPKSQLIICSGFVSVQVVINGIWMLVSPPKAMHHYPTREENLLVCSSYVDASYMIAFGYPIVLIIICTVYAVLTRNIPEAFNESKHIGFTMYTTCVIWLAFVPLFFGTGSHMPLRITSMSVTISLSASVTIACLFSPKLYIILIRPERNVRQSMMPTSKYSGTVKSGTSASVMAAAVAVTNTQRLSQPFINAVDPSVASRCIDIELCSDETGFNRFSSLKIKDPILVTRSTQTVVIAAANEQPSHLMATTNGRPANNNNNNNGPNGRAPYLNFGSAGNLNGDSKIGVSGGINVPGDVTNVLSGSTINVPSGANVLTSATNVLGGAANVLGVATNVLTGATNVLGSAPNILGGATNVLTVTTNGSSVTNNIVGSTTNIVASVTNLNSASNVVSNGPMLY